MDETLEKKLKEKLEKGEIDQEEYDNLMAKFSDLDLLSAKVGHGRKQNYSFSGAKTISGGEISEPIRVSGRMRSTDSVSCSSFTVSGSAVIEGDLKVAESAKISGSLTVNNDMKIGGTFKLSGKASVGDNTYLTSESKISGKLVVENKLMSDSAIKISGRLQAASIHSTSNITLSGKVSTGSDLEADSFITSGGSSHIGGSLKASSVEIAKKYRLRNENTDYKMNTDNTDFGNTEELGQFISNMVTKFIPNLVNNVVGSMKSGGSNPSIFVVNENIEGEQVDISFTHVKGDIVADSVVIGPEVTVDGVIKYTNSISVPEDHQYTIEKIEE